MKMQPWASLWKKLSRQESELAAAVSGAALANVAASGAACSSKAAPSGQQLQTQLTKQLSLARSLLSDTAHLEGHTLEARRQQCTAALNCLQASFAAQLQDLSRDEAAASAEWGAAAQQLQQLPASAQPQGTDACGPEPSGPAPAAAAPAVGSLPPEARALDAFLLRHGTTGEA